MSLQPTTIKTKLVCFLDRDWLDFDAGLHKAFPQARYYVETGLPQWPQGMTPRKVELFGRLMDTQPGRHDRVFMVFDPDWKPEFYRYLNPLYPESEHEWWWQMKPPPYPFVLWRWLGGHVLQDGAVEYLAKSEIHFYATPGDKAHAAVSGKFHRLFAKLATNRKGLVWVRMPELEVSEAVHKGAIDWCGHHAIEWARQEPNRVLFYMKHGVSIRPTAEVKPFAAPKAKAKAARKKA